MKVFTLYSQFLTLKIKNISLENKFFSYFCSMHLFLSLSCMLFFAISNFIFSTAILLCSKQEDKVSIIVMKHVLTFVGSFDWRILWSLLENKSIIRLIRTNVQHKKLYIFMLHIFKTRLCVLKIFSLNYVCEIHSSGKWYSHLHSSCKIFGIIKLTCQTSVLQISLYLTFQIFRKTIKFSSIKRTMKLIGKLIKHSEQSTATIVQIRICMLFKESFLDMQASCWNLFALQLFLA